MLKHCEVCETVFEAARSTARYCSDACKQEAYRRRHDRQHDKRDRHILGLRAVATRYARHVETAKCIVCGRTFVRDATAQPLRKTCSSTCRSRLWRDPVGARAGKWRPTA